VPELEGVVDLAMVLVLDGFLDAGSSSAIAGRHLAGEAGGGRVVATFEVDEFHDYRARRPAMSFVRDHYEQYDAPRLVVRLLADDAGTPYLLMHGPEPDNKWEAFAAAVRYVVERLGVDRVIGLGAVPMAVPHTRPIAITHHANKPELLAADSPWRGELRIPSSAQALLELRLGETGHDAMGFVAHIPHYVAQFDYPQAAVALLEGLEDVTGLQWDQAALKEAGEARQVEIATQIADSDDVRDVVTGLEQQYDAYHSKAANLLAEDEALPSGEEIGAQFEQFLARLEEPEGD
jgi:predicted ATP-grasp superfamily ATP-dependent carboligase